MGSSQKATTNRLPWLRPTLRALRLLLVHLGIFVISLFGAFLIRSDFDFETVLWSQFTDSVAWIVPLKLLVFYTLGHCHATWRRASFDDLMSLLRGATLALLIEIAVDSVFFRSGRMPHVADLMIPRSVLILDWAATILLIGGARAVWRSIREEIVPLMTAMQATRVLIVGANHAGEMLARNLVVNASSPYVIVGFLDDRRALQGTRVAGAQVLGVLEAVGDLIRRLDINEVFVESGQLSGKRFRGLMDDVTAAGAELKVIPAIDDLVSNKDFSRFLVRPVEISDLLQREPVRLDESSIAELVRNRTVMVTGAGGSIGSEICRQLAHFGVGRLLLVDHGENALFYIEQELIRRRNAPPLEALLADITELDRLDEIFRKERPEIVFHAAAHKHVPMMEKNPGEAIKNNVFGTELLATLCDQWGTSTFVLVSTDKAVHPTSVMGCTKLLAERVVQCLNNTSSTRFLCVRFGNVLGSNGSVIPVFQEQIRCGGPVTVTHPDIERYFMTIPEAAQLVLQAASIGKGGEVFVLDMGPSVRVVDLAQDLIRLCGFQRDDIEIKITGLRPGEKLFEELYFDHEEQRTTSHEKLFAAEHKPVDPAVFRETLAALRELAGSSPDQVRAGLRAIVPEYGDGNPESLAAKAFQRRLLLNVQRKAESTGSILAEMN